MWQLSPRPHCHYLNLTNFQLNQPTRFSNFSSLLLVL
jgi:hypothetical protein